MTEQYNEATRMVRDYSKGGKIKRVKRGTAAERRKWRMASRKRRRSAAFRQYQRRLKVDPAAKRRERVAARFESTGDPYVENMMRAANLAANLAEHFDAFVDDGIIAEDLVESLDLLSNKMLVLAEQASFGEMTLEEMCAACAQAARVLTPASEMAVELEEGYDEDEDEDDYEDEDEDEDDYDYDDDDYDDDDN